ncbi:metacaspase [Fusarium oxysporum f. sp. phaseoli]
MSWAFVTALKKSPQQSYVQLLNSIRDELATRYTQKPQLSCSHPLGKPNHLRPRRSDTNRYRHKPTVRHVMYIYHDRRTSNLELEYPESTEKSAALC